MNLFLTVLLSLTAAAVVSVWIYRQAQRLGLWLKNLLTPRGVTCSLFDVPLSPHEWERFAALAVARGVQQKTLLAEAIKFYLQEKVK